MKRTIFSAAIAMALCALLCLAGCSGKSSEPDPNAGVYIAESAEMYGVEVDPREAFDGTEFSIELLSGGKAMFNYEGESLSMKWSLDGTRFTAKGGGAELSGTLENGVLKLQDLMGMGVDVKLVNRALASQTGEAAENDNFLMNGTHIYFRNSLQTDIISLYISSGDDRGEPINGETISAGGDALLAISVLPDGPGAYNVRAVDTDNRCYDVDGVLLDGTRLVALTAADEAAYIVLIDGEGATKTYTGTVRGAGQ